MTPSRPYLLRAIYEWLLDNDLTPHLMVDAKHELAVVPQQFVEDGKIVLNINPSAVQSLVLENDAVSFSARFAGQPFNVYLPMQSILAIYARENGKGTMFKDEEGFEFSDDPTPTPPEPEKKRPALRIVK